MKITPDFGDRHYVALTLEVLTQDKNRHRPSLALRPSPCPWQETLRRLSTADPAQLTKTLQACSPTEPLVATFVPRLLHISQDTKWVQSALFGGKHGDYQTTEAGKLARTVLQNICNTDWGDAEITKARSQTPPNLQTARGVLEGYSETIEVATAAQNLDRLLWCCNSLTPQTSYHEAGTLSRLLKALPDELVAANKPRLLAKLSELYERIRGSSHEDRVLEIIMSLDRATALILARGKQAGAAGRL